MPAQDCWEIAEGLTTVVVPIDAWSVVDHGAEPLGECVEPIRDPCWKIGLRGPILPDIFDYPHEGQAALRALHAV